MGLYAFELGRKKELSIAELCAVLGQANLVESTSDCAIFEINLDNPQHLQDDLGGTIKIIEIFAQVDKSEIKDTITRHLQEFFEGKAQGKTPFAISTLSFKDHKSINIKELLNFSKKFMKSLGISSRFVNKPGQNPPSSTIYKARVIEKGIEICLIKGRDKIYLGQTVAIQDIDDYSLRDYNKPCRDAKAGMMPPKLAQIMINLAGPGTKSIYDPFCGTGTILMEAVLMGKTAIGSDIEPRMTAYSSKNLLWLKERFKAESNFRLFDKDARFLIKANLPEKIYAIVTEGYLGEPQEKWPSDEKREIIFRELANLHLNWLSAVGKITDCPIVMCLTAFKKGNHIEHFPRFEEIAQTAGYKIEASYLYDRPDQIVAREIKVLKK